MSVDRCVCMNVTFKRLLELARQPGWDFLSLQQATGCGTACGMCVPYIHVALKTGRTRQPIMTGHQLEMVMKDVPTDAPST